MGGGGGCGLLEAGVGWVGVGEEGLDGNSSGAGFVDTVVGRRRRGAFPVLLLVMASGLLSSHGVCACSSGLLQRQLVVSCPERKREHLSVQRRIRAVKSFC